MKRLIEFSFIGLILFLTISTKATAQQCDSIKYGVELDALPYLTGGYYGSAWAGYKNLRFRLVAAKAETPSFVVADGFENLDTKAYAFIVDYFPYNKDNSLTGLWVAAGLEYWNNTIKNSSDHFSSEFNNYQFTVGGGYVIKIWENLYINPWVAGHLRIAGDKSVNVGNKDYSPHLVLPEASIKLGWQF
jgi:hypothetical protein